VSVEARSGQKSVAQRPWRRSGAARSSQCRVPALMASAQSCCKQTRSQWPSPQPSAMRLVKIGRPRHRASRAHPTPPADPARNGRCSVPSRSASSSPVRQRQGRCAPPDPLAMARLSKRVAWRVDGAAVALPPRQRCKTGLSTPPLGQRCLNAPSAAPGSNERPGTPVAQPRADHGHMGCRQARRR
jgi:hypothetical protein